MKKIYYNKLVRDKIPDKIIKSGGSFEIRRMEEEEFETELLKKAGEEASGLMNAMGKKEIISELGDILDVLDEIKKHFKISDYAVKKSRKEEMSVKGGFQKRFFLIWSEDTGYKSNERRYEARRRKKK